MFDKLLKNFEDKATQVRLIDYSASLLLYQYGTGAKISEQAYGLACYRRYYPSVR